MANVASSDNTSKSETLQPHDHSLDEKIEEHQHDASRQETTPFEDVEMALWKALGARRFEPLDNLQNPVLATMQLTTCDVTSTVVTILPHARRRCKMPTLSSNQESRETVYGAPKSISIRFNKGQRRSYRHQAQLFRRSLPALSIPAPRLHRELLLERDAFMAQLVRERDEKNDLESRAATRIQACYRGFRSRPRNVTYARRRNRLGLGRSVSCIDFCVEEESHSS